MKKITGRMFVRKVGNKIILLGVIDNKEELKNEVQYEFYGTVTDLGFSLTTTGTIIDVKEIARGNTPDGLLTEPIWKT